jgi:6-phosphogluconate dehydrogenase
MSTCDIGLIGLGTMGSAITLNIAENGFEVAVWNCINEVTHAFMEEAGALSDRITATVTHEELVNSLKSPRAIILMIPSGAPVDEQIAILRPLLNDEDMIIDAGNANFHDTRRRANEYGGKPFIGIGVSGGEDGARYGPSIMGGGPKASWDAVAPILKSISAKFDGKSCATWMGPNGAGHFVKSLHNGIEYADMQMISETYGVMRDGLGMDAAEIGETFSEWNNGPLQSYLIEISGEVAKAIDPKTGGPMLDSIVDAAGQKGTGRWTIIEAQHLAAPVPAIEAAVVARNLSSHLEARAAGQTLFSASPRRLPDDLLSLQTLEHALIAGKILCYAQGFKMLEAASAEFEWQLPLPEIAEVWRAGCIIRSAMLDDMSAALTEDPDRNLLFAPTFTSQLISTHDALRQVVAQSALHGLLVPALSSGLSYFDTMRTTRGTANMIQGQRDLFGHHGFVHTDGSTNQHGPWAAQPACCK